MLECFVKILIPYDKVSELMSSKTYLNNISYSDFQALLDNKDLAIK